MNGADRNAIVSILHIILMHEKEIAQFTVIISDHRNEESGWFRKSISGQIRLVQMTKSMTFTADHNHSRWLRFNEAISQQFGQIVVRKMIHLKGKLHVVFGELFG